MTEIDRQKSKNEMRERMHGPYAEALSRAVPVSTLAGGGLFGDGEQFPQQLIGARIITIGSLEQGTPEEKCVEGRGGLVIDFQPNGVEQVHRIVFSFNECGMWVIFSGCLQSQPNPSSVNSAAQPTPGA